MVTFGSCFRLKRVSDFICSPQYQILLLIQIKCKRSYSLSGPYINSRHASLHGSSGPRRPGINSQPWASPSRPLKGWQWMPSGPVSAAAQGEWAVAEELRQNMRWRTSWKVQEKLGCLQLLASRCWSQIRFIRPDEAVDEVDGDESTVETTTTTMTTMNRWWWQH